MTLVADPHEIHPSEAAFLKELEFGDGPVIFDVGANTGGWAAAVLDRWPTARVTCFEPNLAAVQMLRARLDNRMRIFEVALSDEDGEATLYTNGGADALASLHKRDLSFIGQEHGTMQARVPMARLERWLALPDDEVDLLKLDVEGHELAVLRGAGDRLHMIRGIVWEFNSCALASRIFFKDFWDLLHPDFAIYQVMSDGQLGEEITAYSPELEDFAAHRDFYAEH